MRALYDGPAHQPPTPGGWLSLDVQHGCAGDMLLGALLGLGFSADVVQDALAAAHLPFLGLRVAQERRGAVGAWHVQFVDEAGRALETAPERSAPRHVERPRAPRRAPRLQREVRAPDAAVSLARFGDDEANADDAQGAKKERSALGRREQVRDWLQDTPVTGADLLAHLAQNELSATASMLAQRAMHRILGARIAALEGQARPAPGRPDDAACLALRFPGRAALDVLCDVVGVAALIDALSPLGIDVSSVPFSRASVRLAGTLVPGPCPWASAALGPHPAHLIDADYPPTTPTGAAWIHVLAGRRAPERMVHEHLGRGAGTLHVGERANLCVARYGALFVEGSAPAQHGTTRAAHVRAVFDDDAAAAGADTLVAPHHVRAPRRRGVEVEGTVDAADLSAFTDALVESGALSVEYTTVTRWDCAQRSEAVTVRQGNKRATVDVVVRLGPQGERRGVRVDAASVAAAAKQLGASPARTALMALDCYDAICEGQSRPSGEDDEPR